MFETTIEKDVKDVKSKTERDALMEQIYKKFHDEFVHFRKIITENGIAHKLFNSQNPEETKEICKEFLLNNQSFCDEVRTWAKKRYDYFNTGDPIPIFKDEDISQYYLEIGLLINIVKNDIILSESDFGGDQFIIELTDLLKSNSNKLIQAAGCFIDTIGFEWMDEKNIYQFLKE